MDAALAQRLLIQMIIIFVIAVIVYIYTALCLMFIAMKAGVQYPWLAWIPVANVLLMLSIANKPWWWFFFFLIPVVNIVIAILVMIEIVKRMNRPAWWVVLLFIPIIDFVILGILAWCSEPKSD